MTEQEWLECADPQSMLEFLRGKSSDRKVRLFAVACCRRVLHLLKDERSRTAVDVAERRSEGQATAAEIASAEIDASLAASFDDSVAAIAPVHAVGFLNPIYASNVAAMAVAQSCSTAEDERNSWNSDEKRRHADLLRDIFGNPFRPVTVERAWLTPTVVSLATAIYDERAFDRLPILADALEDAGCTNAAVLKHCRELGEHVRGCWVVDLLLGKS